MLTNFLSKRPVKQQNSKETKNSEEKRNSSEEKFLLSRQNVIVDSS